MAGETIMEFSHLFEILDIEEIEDFKYFDNLAALLETEEDLEFEEIYQLISQVDLESLSGLIKDYFEDMMSGIPDDETELFMLVDNIQRALLGICANPEDENQLVHLTEEICKFRNWYNFDTDVICTNQKNGDKQILRIKDALIVYRMEKLRQARCFYDFSDCLNYELDEYVISLGAPEEYDSYDYTSGREEEALLESDFLYDDEYRDEQ